MNNSDDDVNPDAALQEKLADLRREARGGCPSPPPSPLPLELQCELKLSANLLKLIFTTEKKPFIFSPSTIAGALNALIRDIDDAAGKEIEQILGKDLNFNKECFTYLLYSNNLFYSNRLKLLSASVYGLKDIEDYYQSIDFNDKIKATSKINDIVFNNTNNKISKLIHTSDISKNISICLGNAATFEDSFGEPFARKHGMFYSNPPRMVDMLYTQYTGLGWCYAQGEYWTCLGIPYKNPKRKLYILLPKERDGLANLIQKFDIDLIKKCIDVGGFYEAKTMLPVFEVESRIILNEHLKELGFTKILEKNVLSKQFSAAADAQSCSIDLAIHSSKIHIDEYGTFGQPFRPSMDRNLVGYSYIEFTADHPFIFFIADTYRELESLHFIGIFS